MSIKTLSHQPANLVTSTTPTPYSLLHRKCDCGGTPGLDGECAECRKKRLQRRATHDATPDIAPPIVHEVLRALGQPLDTATRAFMEPRFGHDFSHVRVHTDARAAESARAVNALAYTVGHDVVFGAEQYTPTTTWGKRLLAHELTHVVQQQSANSGPLLIDAHDSASEREALTVSDYAMHSQPLSAIGRAPQAVACTELNGPDDLKLYKHDRCLEKDLIDRIWPGDGIARQMTKNAINVLNGPLSGSIKLMLSQHFMTTTPNISRIKQAYTVIDRAFESNDYSYVCNDSCRGEDLAETDGNDDKIYLCMSALRYLNRQAIATTILHEFGHAFANMIDKVYCGHPPSCEDCPKSLSASDALDNADSYACFAEKLWTIPSSK